jgi:hypothetical protein
MESTLEISKPRPPSARGTIREYRNRTLGWSKVINELVDNSLGNAAKRVRIEFGDKSVKVLDNGCGCNARMFSALVSLTWHEEAPGIDNDVSMYGVGAKHAFLWAGGPTDCFSIRDGEARYISVDWDSMDRDWTYPDIVVGKEAMTLCFGAGLHGPHGTMVQMSRVIRKFDGNNIKSLVLSLGDHYWPAIDSGAEISVVYKPRKGKSLTRIITGKPLPMMQVDGLIDEVITLDDGRQLKILAGIVPVDAPLTRPGFEYIFGHRVLLPACDLGCGGMDFERVYGRVWLLGKKEVWRVSVNKDDLHDIDRDIVEDAIFSKCSELLKQSQSEAFAQFKDDQLLSEVEEEINSILTSPKKAKRRSDNHQNEGTVKPTGRGSQHIQARDVSSTPGNIKRKPRKGGRIRFTWRTFEERDTWKLGDVNVAARVVGLNRSHPFFVRAREEQEKASILVTAMMLWADAWCQWNDKNEGQLVVTQEIPPHVSEAEAVQWKLSEMLSKVHAAAMENDE